MSGKKDKKLLVSEQIIEDPVSGFSFRFVVANAENPYRVLFKSPTSTTWREFLFDEHGEFSGATTRVAADEANSRKLRLVK